MNPNLSYNDVLAIVDGFDPLKYAKTRNHLQGSVSYLSPYITRGVSSLTAGRARILEKHSAKDAQKFIQELAWREYSTCLTANRSGDNKQNSLVMN